MKKKESKNLFLDNKENLENFNENISDYLPLEELVIYNHLHYFPEEICKLSNLKKLTLHSKQSKLPESFSNLYKLEYLNLWFNGLTCLPESFGTLRNLKTLNISDNQITNLPESISELIGLRELNMNNNHNFTEFPQSFSNLKNLKILDVSYCATPYFPEKFSNLKHLGELILHEPQLYELSVGLAKKLRKNGCSISAHFSRRDQGGDSIWELYELDNMDIEFWCNGSKMGHLIKICRSALGFKIQAFASLLEISTEKLLELIKKWQNEYNISIKGDEIFFRLNYDEFVPKILTHVGKIKN